MRIIDRHQSIVHLVRKPIDRLSHEYQIIKINSARTSNAMTAQLTAYRAVNNKQWIYNSILTQSINITHGKKQTSKRVQQVTHCEKQNDKRRRTTIRTDFIRDPTISSCFNHALIRKNSSVSNSYRDRLQAYAFSTAVVQSEACTLRPSTHLTDRHLAKTQQNCQMQFIQ